jgi:hypothetical protein
MVLLGDEAQVEALSERLEIVLILTQVWCLVCAECTIVMEIILDAPNGSPRRRGSCGNLDLVRLETVLESTQDGSTVCSKCTIGS